MFGSAVEDIERHEANDLYFDGVSAAVNGRRALAERLVRASLALDPGRYRAWLWLAGLVSSPQESLEYLERALALAPGEPLALEGIQWARQKLGLQTSTPRETRPEETPVAVAEVPWPAAAESAPPKHWWRCAALGAVGIIGLVVCAGVLWVLSEYGYTAVQTVWMGSQKPARPAVSSQLATAMHQRVRLSIASPGSITFTATPTKVPARRPTESKHLLPTTATVTPVKPPATRPADKPVSAAALPTVAPSPSPTQAPFLGTGYFRPPWHPARSPIALFTAPLRGMLNPPGPYLVQRGKWIEVDLTQQVLRAFEDDRLAMEFPVSTGLPQTPTVAGIFHIQSKYLSIDMYGPGYYLQDVPYTMAFYRGYTIHGTYWHNKFGRPMSHGCVNMKREDAKRLFNWAEPKLPRGAASVLASNTKSGTLVAIHK